jgi:hypothetical protein
MVMSTRTALFAPLTALLLTGGLTWLGTGSPSTPLHAQALAAVGDVSGTVHFSDIGDQPLQGLQWAGLRGGGRRIEGFSLRVSGLRIEYMCHLQDLGDTAFMPEGSFCGTRGQSRRMEGFAIRLRGAHANQYDIYYECYAEGIGEIGPMRNGAFCGTRGQSRRLEAMNVWVTARSNIGIQGVVHLAELGDRNFRNNELAGTRGQSRRLEGFSMNLSPAVPGLGIEYMCHVQDLGDTGWMPGGSFCGTRGQSRRVEGLAVRLTGRRAARYDVYYLCHLEGLGDTGPVKNGAFCGTRGQSRRLEALYIWVAARR